MIKRIFDIFFSFLGIILLLPLLIIISLSILIFDGLPVFYLQERIGKNFKVFKMIKFRTMHSGSDKKGLLTVGDRDKRVTKSGYFLRKYKLDELPQLFNVLIGDMSFVGPRPEVRKYVDFYNEKQKNILSVKPGITDYASIEYKNESEILAVSDNPEKTYIEDIMPEKIKLNFKYINNNNILTDFKLVFKTIINIFKCEKK